MLALHQRLKLSAFERDLGLFVVTHREDTPPPHPQPLRPYQQLLADYRAAKRVGKLFIVELLHYRGQHQLAADFQAWELPRFPVNGATLKVRSWCVECWNLGRGIMVAISFLASVPVCLMSLPNETL